MTTPTTEAKPRTLTLDAVQWHTLVMADITRLGQFLQNQQVVDERMMGELQAYIEKTGMLLQGWLIASRPVIAAQLAEQARQPPPPSDVPVIQAQPNGPAPPPKKKGGWVKGRKRTRTPDPVAPPAVTM